MPIKNSIRAIIIDDEPGCVSYLAHCLNHNCSAINVVATGNSGGDLLKFIKTVQFDVAFLDIKLADELIFDVIKKMEPTSFRIVFVTAYDNYAMKAIKTGALDYILKPLLKEEIVNCYHKIVKQLYATQPLQESNPSGQRTLKTLMVRTGDKISLVKLQNILYIRAKGAYAEIVYNNNGRMAAATVCKSIGCLEEELDKTNFFRIHKSYLINMDNINNVVKGDTCFINMSNGDAIPVAQRRLHEFLSFIKRDGK